MLRKGIVLVVMLLLIGMNFATSTVSLNEKVTGATIKYSATVLLDENFSGDFPPEGWSTDGWEQCNSGCCSPEPPCAWLDKYSSPNSAYITSKAVDASNYEEVKLRFFFGASFYYPQYSYFFIKVRANETSPWKEIQPWDNPISEDIIPMLFEISIELGPGGSADALQVIWSYIGYYYYFQYACLDEVMIFSSYPNNPPDIPLIDGQTNGKAGEEYEYTFNSTDPEGNPVMYTIDWGDNHTEWTEFCDSGDEITLKHIWEEKGDYTIKAKAKDFNDAESDWGYLEVTMPKNQNVQFGWLERFPLLQRILTVLGRVYIS